MSFRTYLQKQLGVSRTMPHLWLRRKNPQAVSPRHALELEKLFSIPCYQFVWPEKFGNPWERAQSIYKQNINTTKQINNG